MRAYLLLGVASTTLTLAPARAQDTASPIDSPPATEQGEDLDPENVIIVSGRAQKLYRVQETSSASVSLP